MEGAQRGRGRGRGWSGPGSARSGPGRRQTGGRGYRGRGQQQGGRGSRREREQDLDDTTAELQQPGRRQKERDLEPEKEKLCQNPLETLRQELVLLLSEQPESSIPLSNLSQAYSQFYGKELHKHGFAKLIDLLLDISRGTFVITEQKPGETRRLKLIKQKGGRELAPKVVKVKAKHAKKAETPIFVFKSQSADKSERQPEEEDEDKNKEEKSLASSISMMSLDSIADMEELPENLDTKEEEEEKEREEKEEIAIFWDIENCPVPKGVTTSIFVQRIRQTFCSGHREVEFLAINNGKNTKLNGELYELNIETSLSVIDKKNSADDILKEKMKNFVEKRERSRPCKLLLISGDVDFSRDLSRFRYKYKYETVLLHNKQAKETLKSVVNDAIDLQSLFPKSHTKKEHHMKNAKESGPRMNPATEGQNALTCSSNVSLTKESLGNSTSSETACQSLEVKKKGAMAKQQEKIGEVESKQKAAEEALEVLAETKQSASQALVKSEESSKLNKLLKTYDQELNDLKDQREEFDRSTKHLLGKIKSLNLELNKASFERAVSDVRMEFGKELVAFEEALPIYRYRRRVQEAVSENAVTIIMAETGSGKSTKVAQYLADILPTSKMIVCTQPRKIAAVSLASHVARQMGSTVGDGGLVGYKVGSQLKMSKDTRILFMTDQMLLNECAKDRNFSNYSCIILDEVHERSINTDLLLGLTKEGLATNKELKVVITSATMDSEMFFNHYSGDGIQVVKLDIPGRTFPIDIKWGKCPVDLSRGYIQVVQNKTEEVLKKTTRGDLLVFVATPADTDILCERLKAKTNEADVYQLHGRLQIEDQKKIFERGHRRRVIFSTNCAETSVTVPGIKYVIDSGVAKEMKFNPLQNSSSLEIQKINQSSAKQRAGRAGRTEPGVCYRMYSPEEHETMRADMVPDIKKVGLGQTVLKLLDFGIQQPHEFSFIESPGAQNLQHTTKNLASLGAVEIRAERANLTELGRKMAKLPLEPRLSKLLLLCIEAGLGEEGVRLSSLCSVSGNVFFRMGSEEELLQADQKKIAFCEEEGDFLTLLKVYDNWNQVDEKKRSKWCVDNYINGKSMKIARDTARDIRMALKHDCKMDFAQSHSHEDLGNNLLELIFQCFKDNLCLYGGHQKLGYINIWTREAFPLHPSSTYHYLGVTSPRLVVYDRLLTTSRTFLLGVSSVDSSWLSLDEMTKVEEAAEGIVTQEILRPFGSRIMRQNLLGQKRKGLKEIETDAKEMLPKEHFFDLRCNFEDGSITWVSNPAHHPVIKACILSRLEPLKEKLKKECMKTDAQPGSDHTKVLIGAEGGLKDVVLNNEFVDIMINRDHLEILDVAKHQPGAYEAFRTKTHGWVVCFDSVSNAKEALRVLQNTGGTKSCHPLMRSTRTTNHPGFEIKVTFRRRKLKEYGFLKFDSEEDCYAARLKLGDSLFLKNGERISVRPNKKDNVSLFLSLSIRGLGPLQVLRSERPKDVIEEAVKDRGISFKEVFIPMDPPIDSTSEVIQDIHASLKDIVEGAGIESKDYGVNIRQRKPKDFFWVARLTFSSFSLGLAVAMHLKNCRDICWTEVTAGQNMQRREPMTVEHQMTTSFSCCKRVFDAVRDSVETTIKEVSTLCNTDSLELKITEFGAESSERALFVLNCSDMKTMAMAHDALQKVMTGDRLDHPNVKLLLSPGNSASLKRVEEDSGAYLERGRDGTLTIFGSVSQANKARTLINALLSKIIDDGHNTSLESLDKYPNGLVSAMLKEFGVDLKYLHDKEGVHDVKFLVLQRKLRIVASPAGLQQVQEELLNIAEQLPEVGSLGEEEECCPVCLSPPEDGRRLEHCGHIYCLPCLTLQILSSSGALLCSHQDCGSPFVVEDIKPFESDEKVIKKIVRSAVEQRLLGSDSSLIACPSPNCEGVFRRLEKDEEVQDGEAFLCQFCGAKICRRCKSVFHNGMTCQFYQISRTDDNHSLRVWLAERPEDRKLCKGCRAPIEKAGGCLHVHCTKSDKNFLENDLVTKDFEW